MIEVIAQGLVPGVEDGDARSVTGRSRSFAVAAAGDCQDAKAQNS
jgi:hypothetical protein